jgi:nucleotide-binding universal stress UspA family protein
VTSPQERRKPQFRREAKAIAQEIRRIAKQLRTRVRMIVSAQGAAEDAILHTIERGKFDLVVMGASRRPGDTLSFGTVAAALIRKAPCPLVIVAPQMRGATRSASTGPEVAAAG